MSFAGPPPNASPPSGPFEASLSSLASSPYAIGIAIFLLNTCGRFLPFEITKEQEKFLNQPAIRRLIIFVIFFVATRNIITAGLMSLIVITIIGYLCNENSSLYLFRKGQFNGSTNEETKVIAQANAPVQVPGPSPTSGLSMEEQQILKSLSDKAERLKSTQSVNNETPIASTVRQQYKKVIDSLMAF
jgi:hypothetical protein